MHIYIKILSRVLCTYRTEHGGGGEGAGGVGVGVARARKRGE